MKLTPSNLLIILVVLGAALAISQFTKRSGRSKSLRSELVSIDTAKVSKVEVITGDLSVALTEADQGWRVALDNGTQKQTRAGAVSTMLASLSSVEPGRLASKSPSKWKDYQVDSTGTRVKVYEGDEVVTDIVIGRFGVEGQQSYFTYVRLFEDEEVYVAPNFMSITIGKDAASYRDNTLLRLQKDSLTAISFSSPEGAFQLSKGETWYLTDQPADSAAVASYLTGLSLVSSKEFYDEEVVADPTHTVTLSFSNQPDVVLDAYALGNDMVVRSSENKFESFSDPALFEKVFKSQSAFLTTTE